MTDNQYLNIQNQEQARVRAEKIDVMADELKTVLALLAELKRDIRTVREDLRNLDKLRPLRSTEE